MKQSESQICAVRPLPSTHYYYYYHFIAGRRSNFIRNNHQNPGLNATLFIKCHTAQSFSVFSFSFFFVIYLSSAARPLFLSMGILLCVWETNECPYLSNINVFNFLQVVKCQTLKWWTEAKKLNTLNHWFGTCEIEIETKMMNLWVRKRSSD